MMRPVAILTALLAAAQASAQNYSVASQSMAYAPLSGGTSLVGTSHTATKFSPSADDESLVIPLGFSFPYYGQTYSSVMVDTNGLISFTTTNACEIGSFGDSCYISDKVPDRVHSTSVPHNIIAPWWDDNALDGFSSDILYTTSPSQFVIEFKNLGASSFSSNFYALTFKVILNASGMIQIHYGSAVGATGGEAGVGFENQDGSQGASLPLPPTNTPCSQNAPACDPAINFPTNTLFTIGQPVQPDLIVESVNLNSVSKTATNLTVSVSPTFRNFGQMPALGFVWKAWLSTDQTLDAGNDIPLYTSTTPLNLDGGLTITDTGMATIPLPLPANYYVLVQADSSGAVAEASEDNNVGSTSDYFVSGLDIVAKSISGPAASGPGNSMTVEVKYLNQGTDPAGTVNYQILLSTDQTYSANDFVLYSGSKVVNGGQTIDDMVTFTVPDNAPGGDSYYILHILPVTNETSTTNNDVVSGVTVTVKNADLVAVTPDFVDSATGITTRRALFGQPGRVTVIAQNTGGADAKNFHVSVVMSADANLSLLSDLVVGDKQVSLIASGTSQTIDLPFTIPLNDAHGHPWPTGNYYFFALLDSQGQVTELNEQNNNLQIMGPVLISAPAPDLTVVRIDAPASAGVGEIAPVYRVLKNIGIKDASDVVYRYYLSANQTITPDDIPLAIVSGTMPVLDGHLAMLTAGQVDAATELVQVPGTVTPGTWYIGVLIDPDNTVLELDETNNGLATSTVQVAPSSLRVATPSLPDAVLSRNYNFVLSVTGDVPGTSSTWTLDESQGPLPPGLSLSTAGALTGTPTMTGAWGFTVVVNNAGRQAVGRLAMRVLPTTTQVEITTSGLPSIVNSPTLKYEVDLGASGGALPYAWSIVSGTLPQSLTLDPKGVISGFPRAGLQEGSSAITVQVRDSLGTTAQHTFTVRVVAAGSVLFQKLDIPDGLVGLTYSTDIPVVNADMSPVSTPLTFNLVGGQLPPGMSLHVDSGREILDGTPLVAGVFPFTLQVIDGKGRIDEGDFVLRVYPARLQIAANGLPEILRPGDTVDFNFLVTGDLNATFSVFSGVMPKGVSMDAKGHVTGTVDPAGDGTYNFVVEADDPNGASGLGAFTLSVNAAAKTGGCSTAPSGALLWLLVAFLPLLALRRRARPFGVVLAAAFALVPAAARADYTVYGPYPLSYTNLSGSGTALNPPATLALPFTFKFYDTPVSSISVDVYGYLALNGSFPSESSNSGIPAGMQSFGPTTLIAPWWEDLSGGTVRYLISGTAPNRYITIEWANVASTSAVTQKFSFEVILYESSNQITFAYGPNLPGSSQASVGIQQQYGTGQSGLMCTSASAGLCDSSSFPTGSGIDFYLPPDLTITSTSVDQIGYAGAGQYKGSALVSNIGGHAAAGTVVRFYLSTDATLDASDKKIGDSTPQTVPANGQLLINMTGVIPAGTAPGQYFVIAEADPDGMIVESNETNNDSMPTGIEVGTPVADLVVTGVTAPMTASPGEGIMANITITNSGSSDAVATKYTWFLSDNQVVTISDTVLKTVGAPAIVAGMPYTHTDTLNLPAGLGAGPYWLGACANFDPMGMPPFGIPEISQVNNCNQGAQPIVVTSGQLTVLTTSLPMATQYAPFGMRLQAGGANGAYTWQVGSGSTLPPGMHLSPAGDLQGSPAVAGSFTFVVQVASGGATKTQQLMLTVAPGNIPLTVVDQDPPAALFGEVYQSALIAVGGKPPYTWALKPDAQLPQGLNISNDGLIEGRALMQGDFSFGVTCTDTAMTTATKDLRIRVVNPTQMHIATSKLKTAYLKQDYLQELDVVGGKPMYTWTITRFQQLPQDVTQTPGMDLMAFPQSFGIAIANGNTAYLKGTPQVAGLYVVELHVTDMNQAQDATTFLLEVSYTDPLAITTTALPDAFVDHPYSVRLSHNRNVESTGIQFSIPCVEQSNGSGNFSCAPADPTQNLPPGLSLASTAGADGQAIWSIAGTPQEVMNGTDKTYSFLVKVTDDAGRADVRSLSIRLRPAIVAGGGCGCDGSGFAPLALLALAAMRRRKPASSAAPAKGLQSNGARP
jgi:subtilase family serine protease